MESIVVSLLFIGALPFLCGFFYVMGYRDACRELSEELKAHFNRGR